MGKDVESERVTDKLLGVLAGLTPFPISVINSMEFSSWKWNPIYADMKKCPLYITAQLKIEWPLRLVAGVTVNLANVIFSAGNVNNCYVTKEVAIFNMVSASKGHVIHILVITI